VQRIVVSGVRTYEDYVYGPLNEAVPDIDAETRRATSEQGRRLIEAAEALITAYHRKYMEAALMSMWVRNTEAQMARRGQVEIPAQRMPAVAFVDLTGFTQMIEAEGDDASVWLAGHLVSEAEVAAAEHGSRIVKLLGDGLMLHGDDPGGLIETVLDLVCALPRAGLPPAHAGIHAGPLIERDGDYFGHTVNVASRIAGHASAHEVLMSTSAAARAPAGVIVTELAAVSLRGVSEPVALFRAERPTARTSHVKPIVERG
jgi:class 3 adenylate cyclase